MFPYFLNYISATIVNFFYGVGMCREGACLLLDTVFFVILFFTYLRFLIYLSRIILNFINIKKKSSATLLHIIFTIVLYFLFNFLMLKILFLCGFIDSIEDVMV